MNYFKKLNEVLLKLEVKDSRGKTVVFDRAISKIINLIVAQAKNGGKVIFIGNGGSASIASHLATDFLKNAKIPAMTFNDPSLLTCLSNDYGYEYVFEKPLEVFTNKKDILFAVSSSGKSTNILRSAGTAKKRGLKVITLSGFREDNPLRRFGYLNFYVPSLSYGYVEIAHLSICHCLVDMILKKESNYARKKS